jgi:heat shock protein HslJ
VLKFVSIPALALAGVLQSCATPPATPAVELAGTDWHVVAVDGRTTPDKGDYSMHFGTDASFGAKFGCNSMGGSYQVTGSTVTVTNLISTLMACGEPAASFESQGSAILGKPMHIAFTSGHRMTLGNAEGSMTLDPVD